MGEEGLSGMMGKCTTGNGCSVNGMGMERRFMLKEKSTLGIGDRTKSMDTECINGGTAISTTDSGRTVSWMVRDVIPG